MSFGPTIKKTVGRTDMYPSRHSLCRGVSLVALAAFGMSAARAQDAPPPEPATTLPDAPEIVQDDGEAEIVVTGTSIRGAGSVGSNVISVGRQEIDNTSAQTVQQILRSIPALTGSGSTPQGNSVGNSFYQPTIHSLGSSSSNSTLVLVDGHRISPGSQQQTLTDPNIIPPIALERVEVLAEGASSIYGSDAVAGVVNFITRRRYDGLMVTGQAGFGDDYRTYNAGVLWGTTWDRGSVMLAYNFSNRSALAFSDRINRDYRSRGGTNFGTFFCAPATIQPQGVSGIYPSPTATAPVANNSANAPCQIVPEGDIFPEETRHNAMFKVRYEVTPDLTVGLDVVYSNLRNRQATSRGTLTATVFRTGAQANPFYVNPPGVVPGTTAGDRQQVRWNADELLGPGAFSYNDAVDYYFAGDLEYRFGNDLRLTALALYGREDSMVGNEGQLCVSCANLALNGTTNAGGSLTQPSIPGTSVIVTTLPLDPSNALDVWNPAATNRTSQAVLDRLTDNITRSNWYYSMKQARIGLDGPLLELPGGSLRFAIGGEYVGYALDINRTPAEQYRAVIDGVGILRPLPGAQRQVGLCRAVGSDHRSGQ
jgi:iron complex outermembrane receptor protein